MPDQDHIRSRLVAFGLGVLCALVVLLVWALRHR
jgi:hypothetical protein